ncbi:hypothetical protein A6U87_09060 [Rhizobium sp. AC44/96]|nr:hypothetical protein A6U87_09060 [Rhizobium sp. AC44/96]
MEQVVAVSRAQEDTLLTQYLQANASDSGQETLLGGLEQLKSTLGATITKRPQAHISPLFRRHYRPLQHHRAALSPASTAAQDLATRSTMPVTAFNLFARTPMRKLRPRSTR